MSRPASVERRESVPPPESPDALVRAATREDALAVAVAVHELLLELGATPPPRVAMQVFARSLVDDPAAIVLVAQAEGAIVGVLGASVQKAIHVSGPYALIQELWVHRSWRSRAIGASLIAALCELARAKGIARVEVGLPRKSFANVHATESFYTRNGFEPLGDRMRRSLA